MLQFNKLSLRHGAQLLFDDCTLRIHPGWKVGIAGANGTGKSSLMALILGELHADLGDFSMPSGWETAHVAQQTPDSPAAAIDYVLDGDKEFRAVEQALVVAETENDGEKLALLHGHYDAIGGYQAPSRAAQLMHGLGFETDQETNPVNSFSGGWRMRLNLARALMCRSDLLLLDEPTNHLDLDAVIWLEKWLLSYQGTLLLISHDRDFLDRVVGHIVNIARQQVTLYQGNYTAFEHIRAERLANQQAAHEKQQREVAHMQRYVDRFRAKATKARQAQSRIKALERMTTIAPAHVDSPFHFSFKAPLKNPRPLLKLEQVSVGYSPAPPLLTQINLTLNPGDRLGLLGRNGAGKSTLIKLLSGGLQASVGDIAQAQDLKIGYFAQHQVEQLHPEHTPLDHLRQLDPKATEQQLRDYLGGFGFPGDQALRATAPFSGGEKSRLALALLIYQRPNLLLLDEPTNHLDIEMRQALAQALQEFEGAMVIVSHDRHLLRVTVDQLLMVHSGKVDEYDDDLDSYPAWLAAKEREQLAGVKNPGSKDGGRKAQKKQSAEQRKATAALRKQVKSAENALNKLHARQSELEQALADPEIYSDSNKEQLKKLLEEKRSVDSDCETRELVWMEAAEALEDVSDG